MAGRLYYHRCGAEVRVWIVDGKPQFAPVLCECGEHIWSDALATGAVAAEKPHPLRQPH